MQGSQIDGGRELSFVEQNDPLLGSLLRRMLNGVIRVATNGGVSSVASNLPAPPPVDSTQVKGSYNATTNTLTAPGEMLHFVHTHNSPIQRGIQYVTEIDTTPNFTNPHPLPDSTSRSGFHSLPTNNDAGQPVGYYMRVTVQYPGSKPSQPTVYGGLQGPTKIVFSGTTNMTLLTSQSGGTAKPSQGGQGLGAVQSRGSVGGPKRSLPTIT